jgi:hypothetical protein
MSPRSLLELPVAKFNLKEYARRGAEARVAELRAELAQIYRAFPDMNRGGGAADGQTAAAQPAGSPRARRKGMSAAQKKAVSVRMKKYWAARRKAEAQ